jgi:rhamnosyltransferase
MLLYEPGERELRTLELVREQSYPSRISVLGIDSSPDPESAGSAAVRELVDEWHAIPHGTFSHAGTRNLALEHCKTPVIVFLSQDAHPVHDGWLRELIRPLAQGNAVASYGRQHPWMSDPERDATFRFLYPDVPEIRTKSDLPSLGLRTFHFSDVTSAFITEVLEDFRFPTHVPIFEDVGAAKRILDGGFPIAYVPSAAVLHSHQLSLKDILHRYMQIGTVYERLGIFEELRASRRRPLVLDAVAAARAMSTSTATGAKAKARGALIGIVKVFAVAAGRWRERLDSTGHREMPVDSIGGRK